MLREPKPAGAAVLEDTCTNSAQSPSRAVFTVHGWTAIPSSPGSTRNSAAPSRRCAGRLHTCGRRVGKDDHDHAPDREPDRDRRVRAARDPRRHVHGQGGDRDARAAGAARRRRRDGADVSLGSTASVAPPRRSARPDHGLKALLLRQLGNTLPPPYKFRSAGDLATEVEWAKNRRLTPATYLAGARRPRAADPARSDVPHLPRLRGREGRPRLRRLRGRARAHDPALRRASRGAGRGPRALQRVHRRRVPGRQPPAADAPRPLARRP